MHSTALKTSLHDESPPQLKSSTRLDGVDLLRGLVMAVMVLDHTRDFFADGSVNPTDLSRATPALFLTRWITHFCAPTFALLAGVGVRLAQQRGRDARSLAVFLATRGLWLIILEQTVEKFGLLFRFNPGFLLGLVLWSIGGSFIVLSVLVAARAPVWLIGVVGVILVAGHNLLDLAAPSALAAWPPFMVILLRPGAIQLPGNVRGFVLYPLLPWFGVVALGYWLGGVYQFDASRRRRVLVSLGIAAIGLFVLLRASGGYGDASPWTRSGAAVTTALSFLNCTKYPPSLQFLLMTLGPALIALAAFDRGAGPLGKPLVTIGRVPLFYYLLQWYVIHGLAVVVALVRGEPTGWLFVNQFPLQPPPSSVFALPGVYAWWLVVLLILYFPCEWFARFKSRHRDSVWLSYL